MIESTYNRFLLQPSPKLISQICASSDYIVKILKLFCYVSIVGKHLFASYHPYYKNKLVDNQTWTFICATSYLYFGYSFDNLGNLSTAFLFTFDGGTCTIEPDLVTKKGELSRIPSIYTTDTVLTIKTAKIMTIDCEYLTFTKHLPELNTLNLF